MKNKQKCRKTVLVSAAKGDISLCSCGVYHVRINATTLHLTSAQFNDAARLFKLALGISIGRGLYERPWHAAQNGETEAIYGRAAAH
ncbi:MAG: hypothetical protein ACE5GK_10070 [Nitrospiria bacterium]